ncbi:hypothetical protein Agabi119p4_7884 [Agaricus bisporus var. burnettii]|uniref:Uncharacterized protein n=1 Tax=Agaricus bisporus var. burnettii TaxID=192524 RepID=A0A8H7C828_AGABI|nr:hypothetical protein Agabi119p4_7884 [Agaricus bisporus var. burnettii]
MSSDLNNSSTDKPVVSTANSSNSTPYVGETRVNLIAIDLVARLSRGIESTLPVTQLDIDPANSPELENIKDQTSLLPDDTFRAFIQLFRFLDSHQLELAKLRIKAKNNEPIPNGTLKMQEETMINGGSEIIAEHHQVIHEHIGFLDESWDAFSLKIREVFGQTENTEHWQGRLEAIIDDIIPPLSDINPVLAPIEWAGSLVLDIAACEISRKLDQELKKLGILDQALREEMIVAIKTQQTLNRHLHDNELASGSWVHACQMTYDGEELKRYPCAVNEAIIMREINFVDKKLSQLIAPIKEYLVQRNEYYARGITVIREVDCFCDIAPKIFQDIRRIYEAKEIIKRRHRATFEQTVYDLGLIIFSYLGSMRDVFNQRPFDPEKKKKFLADLTYNFVRDTEVLIHDIGTMIDTQSSGWRSKKAEKKRMEGDRCYENMGWRQRPLVKPSEVQRILRRVQKTMRTIWCLAIASGTGKIMESIEGIDEIRAHVTFDASHESLRRLRRVLKENVNADLERLNKLRIKKEPKSYMGQIRQKFQRTNQKC